MRSKVKISNAGMNDIEAIIAIASDTLGEEYLSDAQIKIYLKNKRFVCQKATINNKLVGFSLFRYCDIEELKKLLLIDKKNFDKLITIEPPICFRETTAVKKEFQNQGVGTELIKHGYKLISGNARYIISVAWQQGKHIPIASIIKKNGAEVLQAIPNYWKKDSIERKYSCKICGLAPCLCTGIIFIHKLQTPLF